MSNQLAFVASIAPFSDVANAQWHGSTCETKSDAVGLFEVQQSLEPLHKEGPDPSAAKRTGLTFTSPPLDPRAETDPITARWPLLDVSRKEDVSPPASVAPFHSISQQHFTDSNGSPQDRPSTIVSFRAVDGLIGARARSGDDERRSTRKG